MTAPSSVGDGGVSSTLAYFINVANLGWEKRKNIAGPFATRFKAIMKLVG